MIMMIDIETADLPEQPVVGQRSRPGGIYDKIGSFSGSGFVIDAGLLEQEIKDIALFEGAGIIGARWRGEKTRHHQSQQRGDFG
jgi:hypothetical protein